LFSRLGRTLYITWGPYAAFHGMARKCRIEGSKKTAVWIHLRMFINSKFYYFTFKCWILLKPVPGGVDGNLHFSVPSMNRLNHTKPATFSILPCWAFFRDSVYFYFQMLGSHWPCMSNSFVLITRQPIDPWTSSFTNALLLVKNDLNGFLFCGQGFRGQDHIDLKGKNGFD
jgi:hypothetical protein